MSTYLGTTLLAGVATNTISNGHSLLDFKWTDHILNELSWLRADTFSWQSGAVYVTVYNHLVADISNVTASTETVGSYTITYYQATDGHKIVLADQETTVSNIYAESGVAWYYVLDTTNQRFKLPRSSHGEVVEKYQNGNNWYRIYADGWCEQGGTGTSQQYNVANKNAIFMKTMRDTSYFCDVIAGASTQQSWDFGVRVAIKYVDGLDVRGGTNGGSAYTGPFIWEAKGYLASYVKNTAYKYLYIYVGDFSQSATEQTAGLNSGMFNDKMDLDAGNATSAAVTNLLNLANSTDKQVVNGWGIPDYSAGVAISTGYTAVSNGMAMIVRGGGSGGVSLYVDGIRVDGNYSNTTNEGGCLFAFVKKGSVVTWNTGNISDTPTFFPCIGG